MNKQYFNELTKGVAKKDWKKIHMINKQWHLNGNILDHQSSTIDYLYYNMILNKCNGMYNVDWNLDHQKKVAFNQVEIPVEQMVNVASVHVYPRSWICWICQEDTGNLGEIHYREEVW